MRRILKASALLAAVTLVAVTGAGAAVSPSYQVAGIGIGGPQGSTQFVGSGVGSAGDRARWQASVTAQTRSACAAPRTRAPVRDPDWDQVSASQSGGAGSSFSWGLMRRILRGPALTSTCGCSTKWAGDPSRDPRRQ